MAIISRLDRVMADKKVSVNDLAAAIDLAPNNISRIKTGRIKAVRFSTLDGICRVLKCQPGDLMEYVPDDEVEEMFSFCV